MIEKLTMESAGKTFEEFPGSAAGRGSVGPDG
jgi:hypothetical protein